MAVSLSGGVFSNYFARESFQEGAVSSSRTPVLSHSEIPDAIVLTVCKGVYGVFATVTSPYLFSLRNVCSSEGRSILDVPAVRRL